MRRLRRRKARSVILFILGLLLYVHAAHASGGSGAAPDSNRPTALDTYVHAPDSHYQYRIVDRAPASGYTSYLVRMTSQQWRSPAEVNQCLWIHWMRIYIPQSVGFSTGMLYIRGASTSDTPPQSDNSLGLIAVATRSVVTELLNVPNEPLTFANDPAGPRTEDEIIAYTWRKFLDTGDSAWPLRLPMTKAVVRAMDTVTAIAQTPQAGSHRVDRFFVLGASKRGWTTWTTAAVDPRVVAIAPMVIDVLHVAPSFDHHYRSYGFWAPSVKSYFDEMLMDRIHSAAFQSLMDIEDPYSYRSRLFMPKLLINAAGDQFFLPDSSQFYFDALPGEKHLLYEPNADHSLHGTDVLQSVTAFYQSVLSGVPRPNLQWSFQPDGSIRVTADRTPLSVTLWQANNLEHRDFRLESIGAVYRGTPLAPDSAGVYTARISPPAKGWTAFFVLATFPGPGNQPLQFSTAVRVLPDIEPFQLPEDGKSHLQPDTAIPQN